MSLTKENCKIAVYFLPDNFYFNFYLKQSIFYVMNGKRQNCKLEVFFMPVHLIFHLNKDYFVNLIYKMNIITFQ